jgi:PAS domain S-box-containing protein
MSAATSPWPLRYVGAALATTAAIFLNRFIGAAIVHTTFLAFYGAVLLSAWCGGFGPALLATGVSVISVGCFLLLPGDTSLAGPLLALRLTQFGAIAVVLGWIVGHTQKLQRELAARGQGPVSALRPMNSQLRREIAQRWEAEARFDSAFDHAPFGMVLVKPDGRPLRVNDTMCRMLGYSEAELLARSVAEVTHPEDMPDALDHVGRLLAGDIQSYQIEKRYLHKLGHVVWAELSASLVRNKDGTPLCVIAQVRDITERKRAEEALREAHDELEVRVAQRTADLTEANAQLQREIVQRGQAEQELRKAEHKYRTLVEQLPAITYIRALDDDNRFLYVSPQVEIMTGFSPAKCLVDPDPWIRQLHPDDRPRVLDQIRESSATGEPFSSEYRLLTRDGQVRWFSDHAVVVCDEAGRPLFRRGVAIDITARKKAEAELESLNTRTTNILEHTTAAFFAVDHEGRMTYANPGGELLAGRPRDTLIGASLWEVFPEVMDTVFYRQYERVRAEHVALEAESYVPQISKWLKAHIYPAGDGVSALVEDITEQHGREAAAASDILRALNAHLEVTEAFPVIAAGLNAVTSCDLSSLVLFDDKAEWATVVALNQPFEDLGSGTRFRVVELPGAKDVFAGLPHLVQDLAAEMQFPVVRLAYQLGFRSAMWLPVLGEEGTVGAVGLMWRRYSGGSTVHLPLLGEIAAAIGLAVKKRRLFEEVRAGHERLKVLSQRLIEVQEDERRHIARELHDEIGQQLTGLKLLLDSIDGRPAEVVLERLAEAHLLIDDLIRRVRHLSLDLRPPMLDDLGLLPALLWLFDRYTVQTGVRVNFEHKGLEERVSEKLETAAYRIVQEALTNVARHAAVSEVTVRASTDAGVLRLQVVDHGAGFDCSGAPNACHPGGLAGMHERAVLLGGRMTVESAPGAGTRVSTEFPLHEA